MCERAEQRSGELERSLQLLDRWKSRGDELLYSMIPRTVADRLRRGQNPLTTCQVFVFLIHIYFIMYSKGSCNEVLFSNRKYDKNLFGCDR